MTAKPPFWCHPGAAAIAETEASVAALRQRINDALDQRDAVLGAAPLLGVDRPPQEAAAPDAPSKKTRPSRSSVQSLDLGDLDDAGLKEAVQGSASATVEAFGNLGKTLLAFGGNLADSDDLKESRKLLSAATNSTAALSGTISEAASGDDLGQDDAAALAQQTAQSLSRSAGDLGGAAAKTVKAARDAADDADLGASALDAVTALGNTAASAGLLAFRAITGKK